MQLNERMTLFKMNSTVYSELVCFTLDEFCVDNSNVVDMREHRVSHVLLRIELNNVCACDDFATEQSSGITNKENEPTPFDCLFHFTTTWKFIFRARSEPMLMCIICLMSLFG